MAWRGITLLVRGTGLKQEMMKICPRVGHLTRPTWVNSVLFDRGEDGRPTPAWKKIMNSPKGLREVIVSIKGLSLVPIKLFKSNGTIVSIKELYKFEGITYCAFVHNKNISSLLVVGNKTAAELEACGYTKKTSKHPTQESFAPLIIGVKDNKTVLVNSL